MDEEGDGDDREGEERKVESGKASLPNLNEADRRRLKAQEVAKPQEDDLFFQLDGGHFRLYDSARDPAPIHQSTGGAEDHPPMEEDTESAGSAEFEYELSLKLNPVNTANSK